MVEWITTVDDVAQVADVGFEHIKEIDRFIPRGPSHNTGDTGSYAYRLKTSLERRTQASGDGPGLNGLWFDAFWDKGIARGKTTPEQKTAWAENLHAISNM